MNIYNKIASLGGWSLEKIQELGKFGVFSFRLFKNLGSAFVNFQSTIRQIFFVGNYSLVIILVSGLFVGFVLGLQGDYVLSKIGRASCRERV